MLPIALLVLASALIPFGLHLYVNRVPILDPIRDFAVRQQTLRAVATRSSVRRAVRRSRASPMIPVQSAAALLTGLLVYVIAQAAGYVGAFSLVVAFAAFVANSTPLIPMFVEPGRGSLRGILSRSALVIAFTWALLLSVPAVSRQLDARFTPTLGATSVPADATPAPAVVATPPVVETQRPQPTATVVSKTLYEPDWTNSADDFTWDRSTWVWSPGQLTSVQTGTTRLFAPYRPPVSDYTIESRIESNGFLTAGAYGIFVAEESTTADVYYGGVDAAGGTETRVFAGFGDVHNGVQQAPGTATVTNRTPLSDPHTFRLDVHASRITFSMDGLAGANVTTNQDLKDRVLGVWTDYAQVTVTSFTVRAIQPEPVAAVEAKIAN